LLSTNVQGLVAKGSVYVAVRQVIVGEIVVKYFVYEVSRQWVFA
jgi:hypothetical protein